MSTEQMLYIDVQPAFLQFVPDVISRFGYLHPGLRVTGQAPVVIFLNGTHDRAAIERDFRFCLFRQKIYAETLSLRSTLIDGVMGR